MESVNKRSTHGIKFLTGPLFRSASVSVERADLDDDLGARRLAREHAATSSRSG